MSAETLRRAASLMRERAEAATPGPWWVHDDNDRDVWWGDRAAVRAVDQDSRALRPLMTDEEIEAVWERAGSVVGSDFDRPQDAVHMASWHPVVALAVAKAMDDVALAWEIADEANDGYVYDLDNDSIPFEDTVDAGWVAVARAYLGSDA